jgi:hypothetical protein
MRERQKMNGLGGFEIDHVVRETFDRRLAHDQVFWNFRNRRSNLGETLDLVKCVVYRDEKPMPQTGPPYFVPPGGVIELLACEG